MSHSCSSSLLPHKHSVPRGRILYHLFRATDPKILHRKGAWFVYKNVVISDFIELKCQFLYYLLPLILQPVNIFRNCCVVFHSAASAIFVAYFSARATRIKLSDGLRSHLSCLVNCLEATITSYLLHYIREVACLNKAEFKYSFDLCYLQASRMKSATIYFPDSFWPCSGRNGVGVPIKQGLILTCLQRCYIPAGILQGVWTVIRNVTATRGRIQHESAPQEED